MNDGVSKSANYSKTFQTRAVLARDCRAIAMMFVRLSGTVCIVIITLARISVYGWIVQCSGPPDTKACPPTSSHLFPVPPGTEVDCGV